MCLLVAKLPLFLSLLWFPGQPQLLAGSGWGRIRKGCCGLGFPTFLQCWEPLASSCFVQPLHPHLSSTPWGGEMKGQQGGRSPFPQSGIWHQESRVPS